MLSKILEREPVTPKHAFVDTNWSCVQLKLSCGHIMIVKGADKRINNKRVKCSECNHKNTNSEAYNNAKRLYKKL